MRLIYDALSIKYHGEFARRNLPHKTLNDYSDALEYCDFLRDSKGISWRHDINKYQVSKEKGGERFYLGCFVTFNQAIMASRAWNNLCRSGSDTI